MKTLALTTALSLAIAAPAFANDQLAASLGVDGSLYTTAQLVELRSAMEDGDQTRVDYIRSSAQNGGTLSTKSGISEGHAQLAASLGVDSDDYSVAELAALKSAMADDTAGAPINGYGMGWGTLSTKSGISAGQAQIAAALGVNPADYTLAELVKMRDGNDND